MALIKCPECGKEISDKAAQCPNCGCPITTVPDAHVSSPSINSETQKGEKIYFDGNVAGISCHLSSSIWIFGGLTIPVKSVSAVSLYSKMYEKAIKTIVIISCIGLLVALLFLAQDGYTAYSKGEAYFHVFLRYSLFWYLKLVALGIVVIIIVIIILRCLRHKGMEVISHSGVRKSVVKSKSNWEEMVALEAAALLCLKENS